MYVDSDLETLAGLEKDLEALFGCHQIRINTHVLRWIRVEIELKSTPIHSTHVNSGESDNIQT